MRPVRVAIGALLLAIVPLSTLAVAGSSADRKPVAFTDSRLKVEVNATDGDAGLQVFLDGEAWRDVELLDPSGNVILAVDPQRQIDSYGLTELFSESSEPPFTELPLSEFRKLFPEGTYSFRGTTIDGRPMTGEAVLTHAFPDGPNITKPVADSRVARDGVVVEWDPVTTPSGIDIDSYQVLVIREDPLRVFSVDLPATARRLPVPAEFFDPRTDYKVEVLAIEAGGNQTLTELTFTVR